MGSHSYTIQCPKYEKETLLCCSETRSFHTSGECVNCGFYYHTQEGQMSEEELKELQKDMEYEVEQ